MLWKRWGGVIKEHIYPLGYTLWCYRINQVDLQVQIKWKYFPYMCFNYVLLHTVGSIINYIYFVF